MPLDLVERKVHVAFNFESNYGLPSNDSYNEWIKRVSESNPFTNFPSQMPHSVLFDIIISIRIFQLYAMLWQLLSQA